MKKVIVIGAGILGASTAYYLAKSGVTVTLVDREDLGQATGAAAGIVCPWLSQRRNKAWYALAKNGAKFYPSLIAELEADGEVNTGYAKVGVLSIHNDEDKLIKIEKRARDRRIDAPEIGEITRLSSVETKKKFPILADGYSSIHVSGAARIDGRALRLALVQAAKKYGATFINGNAKVNWKDNKMTGATIGDQTFNADSVIVTAGAWSKEILQPLGINFLVEPQKAQIVHLELSTKDTGEWPVVMSPTNQYMLAFEHGRIVVGTTYENNTGFDCRVTAAGLHDILDKAFAIAPDLSMSTVLETRVGFRPVAPSFLPMIGEIPNFEGLFVANGLGSSGLTVGPYLGSQLAKLVLGLKMEIDLKDYDVAGAIGE